MKFHCSGFKAANAIQKQDLRVSSYTSQLLRGGRKGTLKLIKPSLIPETDQYSSAGQLTTFQVIKTWGK